MEGLTKVLRKSKPGKKTTLSSYNTWDVPPKNLLLL